MFLRCWVLMFYCFGLLVDDFFSRKDAKEQRVVLSVCKIVLPYQFQDIIFKMRCQWFYYLFLAMFLRCWVLMFYCFGLLIDDFFSRKDAKEQRVILSVYEIVLPYQFQDIIF